MTTNLSTNLTLKDFVHSDTAIKNGIDKEKARTINRLIKESGMKVQSSILDDKIRVTAKKIDDLQEVYHMLRTHKEMDIELQMENMKRD